MIYIYESQHPMTMVLRPAYRRFDGNGTPYYSQKAEADFGGTCAFTLNDAVAKKWGMTIEEAHNAILEMGGAEIRILYSGDTPPDKVETKKAPSAPKVIDGPVARDNVKR